MNTSITCRWSNCGLEFSDAAFLDEHVIEHANDQQLSNLRRKCCWESCTYPPNLFNVAVHTFIRHLRLHVYIEMLRSQSVDILSQLNQPVLFESIQCISTPNYPSHILANLQCRWSSCNFRSDSFIKFDEHITEHVLNNNVSVCCWEHCSYASFTNLLSIRLHLLNHAGLASYVCPVCICFFSEMKQLLNHCTVEKNTPLTFSLSNTLSCKWLQCNNVFDRYDELHNHCVGHLSNDFPSICRWLNCPYPSFDTLTEKQQLRHILLHTFSETCRQLGIKIIIKKQFVVTNDLRACINKNTCKRFAHLLAPSSCIMRNGFKCRWKDCGNSSDSAYLFLEHVMAHSCKNSKHTNLCCFWDSPMTSENRCNHVYPKRRDLLKHLTGHVGLPLIVCPNCDSIFFSVPSFITHLTRQTWIRCLKESKKDSKHQTKHSGKNLPIQTTRILKTLLPKPPAALGVANFTHGIPAVVQPFHNPYIRPDTFKKHMDRKNMFSSSQPDSSNKLTILEDAIAYPTR